MLRVIDITGPRALYRAIGFAAALAISMPAMAIDWDSVKGEDVTLFSPGQMTWEYILTASKHSTSKSVAKGTNCRECHHGEEKKIGQKIASGNKHFGSAGTNAEPNPVPGNPGYIPVNVKFAHDNDRLYVRLAWKPTPQQAGMESDYAEAVAMMFSDGTVTATKVAGCWSACHVDMPNMPKAKKGVHLTKYLFKSRTKVSRAGGGEHYKSADKLQALMDKHYFLELWRAELNPGQPAKAVDGYVLDKRHMNDSPSVSAEGAMQNGEWVVVLSRKLDQGGAGHLALVPGKQYQVGFAIHDGHTEGRFHHVSFGYSFTLDSGKADFVAEKQ